MQKCLVIFFPVVKMICFYYQTCLVRLHSYFFNASQGLVMYVLRILWGKKRAISPFLQNSCIMGFALHKCRGRTGRTRVPKGHTACWVMHRIKYILTHVVHVQCRTLSNSVYLLMASASWRNNYQLGICQIQYFITILNHEYGPYN